MGKDLTKATPNIGSGDEAWEEMQDLLAVLRDKSKNNALSGSSDERNAWSGMASELERVMRLNVRVRARLIADLRPETSIENEAFLLRWRHRRPTGRNADVGAQGAGVG